jgi:uncharacterized protein involved in oxidation of intracellular sulfur
VRFLFVLHDAPYGSERLYNGVRWARQMLAASDGHEAKIYLFGDAVVALTAGQRPPASFYNTATMLEQFTEHGGELGCCGTCLDARGVDEAKLVPGAHRSSLRELSEWTVWADKVINV